MSAAETTPLLLRALRGEAVERPPVWVLRQAGRWDPEFRKLRADRGFYEFANDPQAAAEASLLPRRIGVDAIILFYDITTLPMAMGLRFDLVPEKGPQPARPIRSQADVNILSAHPDAAGFGAVLETLRLVQQQLRGSLPVLVFAGAPFTVASYCLGTGKDVESTLRIAQEEPAIWHALFSKLEAATIHFLNTLVAAGADAFQLFDSWAGALARHEYLRWAQPFHRAIFQSVREAPSLLFVKEGPHLDLMSAAGAWVVSLGTTHDLAAARRDYPQVIFQGNVDQQLLRTGTAAQVAAATRQCVAQGQGTRHIVNLNHGVAPDTPVANVDAFVAAVVRP
jgi:uroporphyrinogen decarboxylase